MSLRPLTTAVTALRYLSFASAVDTDDGDGDDINKSTTTTFLFCGIGNQVHVFHRSDLETAVVREPVFAPGLAIHGFSSAVRLVSNLKCSNSTPNTQHLIAVHAARAVAVLLFDPMGQKSSRNSNLNPGLDVDSSNSTQMPMLRVCAVHMFDDWVWHVEWLMAHYHNKMSDSDNRNNCDVMNANNSTQTSSSTSASLSPSDACLVVGLGHSQTVICRYQSSINASTIHVVHRYVSQHDELTWCATTVIAIAAKAGTPRGDGDRDDDDQPWLYSLTGTSFGKVLLHPIAPLSSLTASSSTNRNNSSNRSENGQSSNTIIRDVMVLDAHAGPVMRIVVARDASRMATVSVDRTIRIWLARHSTNITTSNMSISASTSTTANQTDLPSLYPKIGCFTPYLTHFGHLARVWDVAFVDADDPDDHSVVSVAEDRSCRIWSGTTASKQVATYHAHIGRNVWALAVDTSPSECSSGTSYLSTNKNKKQVLLTTGGEDGCIKSQYVDIVVNSNNRNDSAKQQEREEDTTTTTTATDDEALNECSSFKLPDRLQNPRKVGGANDESVRTVVFTSPTTIVVTTDFGRILAAELTAHHESLFSSSKSLPYFSSRPDDPKESTGVIWSELGRDLNGTAFTPCSLVVVGNGLVCGGQTNGHIVVVPTRRQYTPGNNACPRHGTMALMKASGKTHSFDAVASPRPARMIMGVFAQEDDDGDEDEVCMTFDSNDVIDDEDSEGSGDVDRNPSTGGDSDTNVDVGLDHFSSDIFIACPSGDLFHWRVKRRRQRPKRRRGRHSSTTGHAPPLPSTETVDVDVKMNINETIDRGDDGTGTDTDSDIDSVQSTFVATYETHRPSKTSLVTSVCYVKTRSLVITGDKGGRIHVFRVPNVSCPSSDANPECNQRLQRELTWLRVHNDRVSCLMPWPQQGSNDSDTTITTAGFDGLITHIRIQEEPQERQQQDVQQELEESDNKNNANDANAIYVKVQARERVAERADTIVQLFLSSRRHCHCHRHQHQHHRPDDHDHLTVNNDSKNNDDNDDNRHHYGKQQRQKPVTVMAAAFRGAMLTVWDVGLRTQLFRHDVGNWRRAQRVRMSSDGVVKVAFWRAGTLYIAGTASSTSANVINNHDSAPLIGAPRHQCAGVEFHGGRANDVQWCGDDCVITGGEDTVVRITRIDVRHARLAWAQRLQAHISCVSAVAVVATATDPVAEGGGLRRVDINGQPQPQLHKFHEQEQQVFAASVGGADEIVVWVRGHGRGRGQVHENDKEQTRLHGDREEVGDDDDQPLWTMLTKARIGSLLDRDNQQTENVSRKSAATAVVTTGALAHTNGDNVAVDNHQLANSVEEKDGYDGSDFEQQTDGNDDIDKEHNDNNVTVNGSSRERKAIMRVMSIDYAGSYHCRRQHGAQADNQSYHSTAGSNESESVYWIVGRSDGSIVSMSLEQHIRSSSAAGAHNSKIRANTKRWTLSAKRITQHDDGAVLCVRRLLHNDFGGSNGQACAFVSGGSGGVIRISFNDENNDANSTRDIVWHGAHDGGVNCIASGILDNSRIFVASGGDDESVRIALVDNIVVGSAAAQLEYHHISNPLPTMSMSSSFTDASCSSGSGSSSSSSSASENRSWWRSALGQGHHAAVTGIAVVSVPSSTSPFVVSVGADQLVCFWRVSIVRRAESGCNENEGVGNATAGDVSTNSQHERQGRREDLQVQWVAAATCAVPDVASVCARVQGGRIVAVVCGFGLEVIEGPSFA